MLQRMKAVWTIVLIASSAVLSLYVQGAVAAAAAAAPSFDSDNDNSSDDDNSSDADEGVSLQPPVGVDANNELVHKTARSGGEHNDDDDGIYQRNPDYIAPTTTTGSVDAVLAPNRTVVQRSVRHVARCVKSLVTSKTSLAAMITLILFVRLGCFATIQPYLVGAFWTVQRDPTTGHVVAVQWHIQRLIRMVIFLGIIYQALRTRKDDTDSTMDNDDTSDEELSSSSSSSSLLTSILLGPGYSSAAALLRRWLRPPGQKPPNPAFLPPIQQHYTFESLNDRYYKDRLAMAKASKNTIVGVAAGTTTTTTKPLGNNNSSIIKNHHHPSTNRTIVVLDWTGLDSSVSNLDTLRDSVSFLLSLSNSEIPSSRSSSSNVDANHHDQNFDVVVVLESPGGAAAPYAMAAQQLCRLRRSSHHVTVCVDTVAASGGYMIACCASYIIAAPFALVGSIGVVGQSVNVHKVLENMGVRPLVFRGGRDKAPLGLIGEVTDENMAKVQEMIDDVHRAFKRHVSDNRPVLATTIETIATGDVWFGYDALHNGLIDAIGTSDEYLLDRIQQGARVLKLQQVVRRGLFGGLTTVEAELGGVPSAKPDDLRRGGRQRVGTVLAQALLGAESWRHLTSWLAKIDYSMLLHPFKTTTTTAAAAHHLP